MNRRPSEEGLFRTDAVRADLRGHSVRSGLIALGARAGQALIQLIAVVILARVLTPADFGIIAYVVPVAILAVTVTSGALQSAVIHHDELDHAQAVALFRVAAMVNLGICVLLGLAAPLMAMFYNEPRVTTVTIVWAVIIYALSLAAVPEALMKRQMRFGAVMGAYLVGLALGAGVGIAMAFAGAGYWALFVQVASPPVARGAWVWYSSGWWPSARRAPDLETDQGSRDIAAGLTAMRRYWTGLAGFRVVSWAGDQLDRVLVGFTGSAAVLGFYDGARRWGWYPLTELIIALGDVAVSSFSRVRQDAIAYRTWVRNGILPVLALPLPLIAFIFVAADEVVLVLLGGQWLPAVPYVRLMCVAAFTAAPNRLTPWLYLSLGRTGRQLRWALFQTGITILALLVGTMWGPLGIATAFAVSTCLLSWPGVAWAVHDSPVTLGDMARIVAGPSFAALAAAVALAFARGLVPVATLPIVRVALESVGYGVAFIVIWLILPGGRTAVRDAIASIRWGGWRGAA